MSSCQLSRRLVHRLWDSPTFTTWASLASRMLGVIVVLPIVLKTFTKAEVALWQLLVLMTGFQLVADFGFLGTFSRYIAYAFGGAESLLAGVAGSGGGSGAKPNWRLVGEIFAGMRALYGRLALGFGLVLLVGGTIGLVRRVSVLPTGSLNSESATDQFLAWAAWAVVWAGTYASFRGSAYSAFLQGANQVSIVRRWEALFALAGIGTSLLVLALGGRVFPLLLASQFWGFVAVLRNRWLCGRVLQPALGEIPHGRWSKEVMAVAWPAAWRSGVGVLTMYGLIQVSGILVAQMQDSGIVASYLLGLRLVQTINQLAQAPFYSKLPAMAQHWAKGQTSAIVSLAKRGMGLAYWTFVLPCVVLGGAGPWLLQVVGSETQFPSPAIWWLLVWGYFAERFGAMHLQLYALGNRIIAHIANTGAGVLFIMVTALGWRTYGLVAIPAGILVGNLTFYGWYCARLSYKLLGVKPLKSELRLSVPSACFLLIASLTCWVFG